MEFLWLFVLLLFVLSIKSLYNKKQEKKQLITRLADNFGCLAETEFSEEKYRSIQFYYKEMQKNQTEQTEPCFYLDDITWNDLNMDTLYCMLNNTGSAMGEEILFAMLHKLHLSESKLQEKERVISFLQNNEKERLCLQTALALIGKNKKISVFEYMSRMDRVPVTSNLLHYIGTFGLVVSLILLLSSVSTGGILLLGFMIFNIITYYKRKGEIEAYYSVITYLIRMLDHAEKISKEDIPELHPYFKVLKEHTDALKAFRKGAPVVVSQNPTGDIMSFVLDYIRILFHTDLIRFNRMLKQYFKHKESMLQVFETVGFLDSMCAVASFREYLGTYCLPEFTKEVKYEAEELYHLFLKNPVPATINTTNSVLVTGSNASGKSTFLKAAAINAILAQTIHTVCAKRYCAAFFKVYSSMALSDNLFENESYYIVEIKSLKRILDASGQDIPVLCFVDEVLRGTNTVERIAASSRILYTIAARNALMFAATHDIELTYILEDRFVNYHFEEQIAENEILFDYELKMGRATTQNAIALLGLLGYPEEIILKSKETATHFLEKGEWKSATK